MILSGLFIILSVCLSGPCSKVHVILIQNQILTFIVRFDSDVRKDMQFCFISCCGPHELLVDAFPWHLIKLCLISVDVYFVIIKNNYNFQLEGFLKIVLTVKSVLCKKMNLLQKCKFRFL